MSREQVQHDRINLGRLVQRLDKLIAEERWPEHSSDEQAWARAQGMAQKIKYARQLLFNVELNQEQDSRSSVLTNNLENMRETLNKLEDTVLKLIHRYVPKHDAPSYLSLVPIPTSVETSALEPHVAQLSEAELVSSTSVDIPQTQPIPKADPVEDLLPSPALPISSDIPSISQPQGTSTLLSASFQKHEELSDELSRMAAQLKRNAQHFSASLEKDKSFILSASEALEKNYDTMTKERSRLKEHSGKSSSTTWMVFGALLVVSIAWVLMFLVIRIT